MNGSDLIIKDLLVTAESNKNVSYKNLVNLILKKFKSDFLERDFYIDLSTVNRKSHLLFEFLKYSPFQFSFNNNLENRRKLWDDIQKILTPNENELISIGTGCIDENCIMVIGMAAGFYSNDADDKISQPFKPTFFFQNTSEILRNGFNSSLDKIYFTNASKIALERSRMNISYLHNYNKYFENLMLEIETLKPKSIIALGTNVYDFLLSKNIKCTKGYHPGYFIYRNNYNVYENYYRLLLETIGEKK